jgi:hypothetical protein
VLASGRDEPLGDPAAVLLAVATCRKEVSVYALLVLGLLEAFRVLLRARDPGLPEAWAWRPAIKRLATAALGSAALFIAGLWAMGLIATPYAAPPGSTPPPLDSQRLHITGGPFAHLAHPSEDAGARSLRRGFLCGVVPQAIAPEVARL